MASGQRTDGKTREKVMAKLITGNNNSQIARECGVSEAYVRKVKKSMEQNEECAKACEAYAREMPNRIKTLAMGAADLVQRKLDIANTDTKSAIATSARDITGAISDLAKTTNLLAGQPTEVLGGQVTVKKFEDW